MARILYGKLARVLWCTEALFQCAVAADAAAAAAAAFAAIAAAAAAAVAVASAVAPGSVAAALEGRLVVCCHSLT